jgi:hypothetical protein
VTSTFSTTAEPLTRTKARKQAAKDSRKEERDLIRDQKRQLRDLRYIAEKQTIPADLAADFWQQLIELQREHGKEGTTEFYWSLVPRWEQVQLSRGGGLCPDDLKPANAPRLTETHKRVAAALERASRNSRTVDAAQVLQAWAMEDGTV